MSGQLPLDVTYYPSDFQVTSVVLVAPTLAAYPLMQVDRDNIVIDSVSVYIEDNLSTNSRDLKIKVMEPATAGTISNTLPTYATTSQDLAPAKTFSTTGGDFPQTHVYAIDITKNFLVKGSRIWAQWSAAPTGIAGSMVVQIRWRSQV
jgi:hypothetical protein